MVGWMVVQIGRGVCYGCVGSIREHVKHPESSVSTDDL